MINDVRFNEFSKAINVAVSTLFSGVPGGSAIVAAHSQRIMDMQQIPEMVRIYQAANSAMTLLTHPAAMVIGMLGKDPQQVFHDDMIEPLKALAAYVEGFSDLNPELKGLSSAIEEKLADRSIDLRKKVIQCLEVICAFMASQPNFSELYERADFVNGTMMPEPTQAKGE